MACMSPTSELPRLHCEQPYGRPRRRTLSSKRVWTKIKRGPGKGRIRIGYIPAAPLITWDFVSEPGIQPRRQLNNVWQSQAHPED